MKLFKTITTVQGTRESFVDWIETDDASKLRAEWESQCAECGVPIAKASVQFIECNPSTLKPV
jgi:hypothetical protein